MNIERLRKIIAYSDANRDEIEAKVKSFCAFAGISSDKEVLNLMQIIRPCFHKKGYLIFELPLGDEEIGALCYRGDGQGYLVLNTSLPQINVHFALCHELYHVFYGEMKFGHKVEFSNDHYYEHEEEFAANLFAGMLLMPETGFRLMYSRFKEESGNREEDTVIRLMNYYQAPYMAVLIRCYELGLPDTGSISQELLHMNRERVREKFMDLWLDESILDATKKDDYAHVEAIVTRLGEEGIKESYLNERTLKKVLHNMRGLYSEIKNPCPDKGSDSIWNTDCKDKGEQ
ncbi:MAG: ImmA/IrrE family metallo-endopeptidase [Lachnospiraceae bacterium]|jgi:Zn-dependent peptidase ImmA (M78 family)|nr:ImmA/IrrE family metallo-endopeptidase [Lachnospiraceae bacterium]